MRNRLPYARLKIYFRASRVDYYTKKLCAKPLLMDFIYKTSTTKSKFHFQLSDSIFNLNTKPPDLDRLTLSEN